MARDINTVALTGNLAADAEVRQAGERQAIGFRIAVGADYYDGENTVERAYFFSCTLWRKSAGIAEYLKKGQPVAVSGSLKQTSWEVEGGEKRYSVEVDVNELRLLNRREGGSGDASPEAAEVAAGI